MAKRVALLNNHTTLMYLPFINSVYTFFFFIFPNANAGMVNLRHLSLFLCTWALPKSHKRLGADNSAVEIRKGST